MPTHYFNLNSQAWKRASTRHACSAPLATRARYAGLGEWLYLMEKMIPPMGPWPSGPSPVFIVGHWRSGTTLLHELLCALDLFAYPTTHACMNPQTFLLSAGRPLTTNASAVRPMDGMVISSNLPQEDEYALLCQGAPSPYEAFLFPKALAEVAERSSPGLWSPEEETSWRATFLRFCAASQKQAPERPLLLKSPSHSFRIDYLARLLPDARFIFLVRHPKDVFQSTRKMWHVMWKLYALEASPQQEEMDRMVLETMAALDMTVEKELPKASRAVTIRFEDFLADPRAILGQIVDAFGMPQSALNNASDRIAALQSYSRAPYALQAIDTRGVEAHCARLYTRHGYETGS